MKPKENKVWTVVAILVLAALCSFFLVDKFKVANGQFHQDATHTYSERVCTGRSGSGSRVCTNYFFTEKQHRLNTILDQTFIILLVLVGAIIVLDKVLNPEPKDKMSEDPVGTMKTGWEELMKQNEEQRKDPSHGWTLSGLRTFLGLLVLLICFTILGTYLESTDWLQNILKIN